MRAVLLSARVRKGTGEVMDRVRSTVTRHATIAGEFDVNDELPASLGADRAVVVGGDGAIMAALRQCVGRVLPAEMFDYTVEFPLILDMAASPGGKTTHLAARIGDLVRQLSGS